MKSTQTMRDRCRELSTPSDDYDRAVICILDDFEALQARVEELEVARGIDLRVCASQLDQSTVTIDVARARIEALEAALREIAAGSVRSSCIARDVLGITFEEAMARAVLDKDAGI
jgi:hypothetical protein